MRKESRIYKARLVYYYTCSICKEQRQTYHKPVRERGICRKHQESKVPPGQETLFVGMDPGLPGADHSVLVMRIKKGAKIIATGTGGGSRDIASKGPVIHVGSSHRKAGQT